MCDLGFANKNIFQGREVSIGGFISPILMIIMSLPKLLIHIFKIAKEFIPSLTNAVDIYNEMKTIEELEKTENRHYRLIETILYFLIYFIQISKLTIGLSFFVMDYIMDKCIGLVSNG